MTLDSTPDPNAVLSDESLMRRIQADDLRAFEELYDRYGDKAFGLACLVCHDSQRAEEATQEAFLTIWSSRASYDPARGSARVWLMTVVRHRSVDMMRHCGRHDRHWAPGDQLDYIQAPDSVAEDIETQDQGRQMRTLLAGLPERQREVIALAYFEGLSHTEIAACLQLPAGTVKGRMRLGLNKLRVGAPAPRLPGKLRD